MSGRRQTIAAKSRRRQLQPTPVRLKSSVVENDSRYYPRPWNRHERGSLFFGTFGANGKSITKVGAVFLYYSGILGSELLGNHVCVSALFIVDMMVFPRFRTSRDLHGRWIEWHAHNTTSPVRRFLVSLCAGRVADSSNSASQNVGRSPFVL